MPRASRVDRLSERVAMNNRTIDREVDGYVATLIMLMQRRILRELVNLPDRTLRQQEALRLIGGMESLIIDDEQIIMHIESLDDIFALQGLMMMDLYELANDEEPPPLDATAIPAVFANSRQQNVQVMARAYANEVRQKLTDSLISRQPVNDFDVTEAPTARIVSALSNDLKTANATFSRMVALNQGSEYVLYAGPRDARNRPFCAERVNNIYPIQMVYTWDNGQGLPAHLYCGGWGCRHVLIPVRGPGVGRT